MQVEDRAVGDVVIMKVTGDITLKRGADVTLRQRVLSLIQRGHTKLLFDLGSVTYVDSAGLGELVPAHAAAKNSGGALRLFSLPKRVHELLVITSLSTVFDRYDDEVQALASFR